MVLICSIMQHTTPTCTFHRVQISRARLPPSDTRMPDLLCTLPYLCLPTLKPPGNNMKRSNAIELRSVGNNRPSSAAPHRLGGEITRGFRPGSGGARARLARGVGGSSSFLPPAAASSQPGYHAHLFSPSALSATYGPLSEAARKVRSAKQGRMLMYCSTSTFSVRMSPRLRYNGIRVPYVKPHSNRYCSFSMAVALYAPYRTHLLQKRNVLCPKTYPGTCKVICDGTLSVHPNKNRREGTVIKHNP